MLIEIQFCFICQLYLSEIGVFVHQTFFHGRFRRFVGIFQFQRQPRFKIIDFDANIGTVFGYSIPPYTTHGIGRFCDPLVNKSSHSSVCFYKSREKITFYIFFGTKSSPILILLCCLFSNSFSNNDNPVTRTIINAIINKIFRCRFTTFCVFTIFCC